MFVELVNFQSELLWKSFITVGTHVTVGRLHLRRMFEKFVSLQQQAYLEIRQDYESMRGIGSVFHYQRSVYFWIKKLDILLSRLLTSRRV